MIKHTQPELDMLNIKIHLQHPTTLKHEDYMICGKCGKLHPLTKNKDFKCSCERNLLVASVIYNKELRIITSENNTKDQQQKIYRIPVSNYQLEHTHPNKNKHIRTVSFSEDENKIEFQADYITSLIFDYKNPNNPKIDFHHTPRKATFNKRTKKLKLSKKDLPYNKEEFRSFYKALATYWNKYMPYAHNLFRNIKSTNIASKLNHAQVYLQYPVLLDIFRGKTDNQNSLITFIQMIENSSKLSDKNALLNALKQSNYKASINAFTGHTKFIEHSNFKNNRNESVLASGFILNSLFYGLDESRENVFRYKRVIKKMKSMPVYALKDLINFHNFKKKNQHAWSIIREIKGLSPIIQDAIYNEFKQITDDTDDLRYLIKKYHINIHCLIPMLDKFENAEKQELVDLLQSVRFCNLNTITRGIQHIAAKNYGGFKFNDTYFVEFKLRDEVKPGIWWEDIFPVCKMHYMHATDTDLDVSELENQTFIYTSIMQPILFNKTTSQFMFPNDIFMRNRQTDSMLAYRQILGEYLHIFA